MKCLVCKRERNHFQSGVVKGEFISERCDDCFLQYRNGRSSGSADYNLDRAREDYAGDILQPFLPGGVPNPEFAHRYPIKAKEYYTKEQLEDL